MKDYNLQDTIVVAGSPRSGTTWLAELLSATPEYALIFEPLHPVWFPEAARSGFKARTYIPPGTTWISGEKYLKRVLSGEVVSARFIGLESFRNSILSHKLIVKFVRANRLLPWMSERFDVRKIILLIRHPCAVVASQLRSGYYGYNDISFGMDIYPGKEEVISEAEQIESIDENTIRIIEKIKSQEEILAAVWCLDNFVPISSKQNTGWLMVPYENLMTDNMNIKHIADICGISSLKINMKNISKPSKVSLNDLKAEKIQQISKWKNRLSRNQIKNILNIVTAFGLDFYNETVLPDYNALKKIGHSYYNLKD